MKAIFLVVTTMAAACDGARPGPDAELRYGPHDQITQCDIRWIPYGLAPTICDTACAVMPADPVVGARPLRCLDQDRPCYSRPACSEARSPRLLAVDCAATFVTIDGAVGCCRLRDGAIPTFFECPP